MSLSATPNNSFLASCCKEAVICVIRDYFKFQNGIYPFPKTLSVYQAKEPSLPLLVPCLRVLV